MESSRCGFAADYVPGKTVALGKIALRLGKINGESTFGVAKQNMTGRRIWKAAVVCIIPEATGLVRVFKGHWSTKT